ncbi:hypothetical protein D3C81_1762860 [compost metagenome]
MGAAGVIEVGAHGAEQAAGLDRIAIDDGLFIGTHGAFAAGLSTVGLGALGVLGQVGHFLTIEGGVELGLGLDGLGQGQAGLGVGRGAVILQRAVGGDGGRGLRCLGCLLLVALAGGERGRDGDGDEQNASGTRGDHAGYS